MLYNFGNEIDRRGTYLSITFIGVTKFPFRRYINVAILVKLGVTMVRFQVKCAHMKGEIQYCQLCEMAIRRIVYACKNNTAVWNCDGQ